MGSSGGLLLPYWARLIWRSLSALHSNSTVFSSSSSAITPSRWDDDAKGGIWDSTASGGSLFQSRTVQGKNVLSLSSVWQHEKCWYCKLWSLPPFPSFGFWSGHLTVSVSESHICPVDILLSTLGWAVQHLCSKLLSKSKTKDGHHAGRAYLQLWGRDIVCVYSGQDRLHFSGLSQCRRYACWCGSSILYLRNYLMRGRTMAALELDKLEVTVYVYHENTCTFGGVYVPCIYTHAR